MIKIEFLFVRSPRWANEDQRAIDCLVKTNTLVGEHPFTASLDDSEPHGRELYARCLSGEFGEIAPMEPRGVPGSPVNFEIPQEHKLLEKFLIDANRENERKSSRSVTIVWGTALDNLLDAVLEDGPSGAGKSGRPRGKGSNSFGNLIKLAKERGLIDDADVEKCNHIKLVRNAAAHEVPLSLDNEGVLSSLRALHQVDHSGAVVFHEDLDFLIQQVYSVSCFMLALKLARSLRKDNRA